MAKQQVEMDLALDSGSVHPFCGQKTWNKSWVFFMRPATAVVLLGVPLSLLSTLFFLYYTPEVLPSSNCPISKTPSPTIPPSNQKPKFWHFLGVTAPFNHDGVKLIQQTWGSRVNITWYSDSYDDEIKPVIVEDSTYLGAVARNAGYQYMTQKLLWIWNHTFVNSDAEWFIRVYDDNYVFLKNLNRSLQHFNPNMPVLIGRIAPSQGAMGVSFVDGGSGWALSRAAMRLWGPLIGECAHKVQPIMSKLLPAAERCKLPPKQLNVSERWCAEDVFLSYCLQTANVTMLSWPWIFRDWRVEHITEGVPEFGANLQAQLKQRPHPNLIHYPVVMHTNKIHFTEFEERNPNHF